ncbi:MAG TPA: alpha/beta hydrolase fold domain-containing protein [Gemmatimonadaceae bacterium]
MNLAVRCCRSSDVDRSGHEDAAAPICFPGNLRLHQQAPEHRFPAADDDTFAAYRWTLANARELGGDSARIAIAGESAGGNMAADVCLRARDGDVQMPVHQVLVYPVADISMSTESYAEMTQPASARSAA